MKRLKGVGDLLKSRNRHRLQIVAAVALGKDWHFRGLAVTCQFGRCENFRRWYVDRRCDHSEPGRGHAAGLQPFADAAGERRLAKNKERYVRAELQREVHQCRAREPEPPHAVQAKKHGRCVRAATAQARAHRNALVDADRHPTGDTESSRPSSRSVSRTWGDPAANLMRKHFSGKRRDD